MLGWGSEPQLSSFRFGLQKTNVFWIGENSFAENKILFQIVWVSITVLYRVRFIRGGSLLKLRYLSNHRSKRLAGKCVRKRWLHSFQKNSPHIIRPQSLWFLSTFEDDWPPSSLFYCTRPHKKQHPSSNTAENGSRWGRIIKIFFLKNTTQYLSKTVSNVIFECFDQNLSHVEVRGSKTQDLDPVTRVEKWN